MSYKFDSLIIILNKLNDGETVTVHSLMNELENSERTIHRYIKTLQVAGFPINYNRSKETYAFDEGYSLRKPNLTIEETLALAFALAKKVLGSFGAGIEKSLESIEDKLSRGKVSLPKHIILAGEAGPSEADKYLSILHNAIVSFQKIEIAYRALHSDQKSSRRIDPYYLFFQDGFWYLRGYCHSKEELRTFALDRIISMKVLKEHFLPRKIVPEDDLSGAFGSVVDGEPVEVVLRFDPEIRPYVLRKKWHHSQQVKIMEDESLELRFNVNGLEGIKQWVLLWLPHVEVVSPKELRESISHDLKAALARFDA